MIHYHGGPITPLSVARDVWRASHACVSFAHPGQVALAAEVCQSMMFDSGAYSYWQAGQGEIDIKAYADWVHEWKHHPGFDFCIAPDKIDGTEDDNRKLIAIWQQEGLLPYSVPVWHLHESLEYLQYLVVAYRRIAFGSSGIYSEPGSDAWWGRMHEAMEVVCKDGRPQTKLHGLRMLNPTIFSHIPLSSADSTNVAVNIGIDSRWTGSYQPLTPGMRALVLKDRIEAHASAPRWNRPAYGTQMNLELVG